MQAKLLTLLAVPALLGAMTADSSAPRPVRADYWFRGKAEIVRFDVERRRYGEARRGQTVMIFVTEDFLERKQVKLDAEVPAGDRKRNVLKLNRIERFATGLYDYSMMTSVFSPMDRGPVLKTTTSIQDWCGHVWMQCNRVGTQAKDQVRVEWRSYFQAESDSQTTVAARWLEDELWTRIRIDPKSLPTGDFEMLPSSVDTRLHHYTPKPEAATGKRTTVEGTSTYSVEFQSGRSLSITYASAFPHRIRSFVETRDGKVMSKGTSRTVELVDYWNKKDAASSPWREKLALPTFR